MQHIRAARYKWNSKVLPGLSRYGGYDRAVILELMETWRVQKHTHTHTLL